jgi:hypothetical protein
MEPPFLAMGPSAILHVLGWLTPSDLAALACVSSDVRRLALDEALWRALCSRHFPGAGAPPDGPANGCWRQEALRQTRARQFQKAYSQGRVGRVTNAAPTLERISHYDTAERATAATATAAAASAASAAAAAALSAVGDTPQREFARQGTCSWSVLGRAPPAAAAAPPG